MSGSSRLTFGFIPDDDDRRRGRCRSRYVRDARAADHVLCLDAPDEEKVSRLFTQSEFLQGGRP
jgi:hypothetical protein